MNALHDAGHVWRDFVATLEGLENEAISNLNLNSVGGSFCLETARNGAGYRELLNIVADVSELDPVGSNAVRPVDIIRWKQTESATYVPYGWPGKFGYWDE